MQNKSPLICLACLFFVLSLLVSSDLALAAASKIDLYPQDGSRAAGNANLLSNGKLRVGVQRMQERTYYDVLLSVDDSSYDYAGTFRTNSRGQGSFRLTIGGFDFTIYRYVEIRENGTNLLILKGSRRSR